MTAYCTCKIYAFPVVNSAASTGLRAITRSEVLALRSDLKALATKGQLNGSKKDSEDVMIGAPDVALSGDGTGTVDSKLAESALQGKLIQGELERETLKAQRLAAIREKAELQKKYDTLLAEKQDAEKQLLEADHERLKAAKALMDLELEFTVNKQDRQRRQ